MPLYEYSCPGCGSVFETFRRISESRQPADCPECGAEAPRIFSAAPLLAGGLSRSVPEWRPVPGGKPINQYTKR